MTTQSFDIEKMNDLELKGSFMALLKKQKTESNYCVFLRLYNLALMKMLYFGKIIVWNKEEKSNMQLRKVTTLKIGFRMMRS
jgi:hypothetical protein